MDKLIKETFKNLKLQILTFDKKSIYYKYNNNLCLFKVEEFKNLINLNKDLNNELKSSKYLFRGINKVKYSNFLIKNNLKNIFKKNIEKTCYIIVFRMNDKNRLENLLFVIKTALILFDNKLDIIIVEQDKEKKINNLGILDIKYLFNFKEGYFSRGKAFNFGLEYIKDKKYENVILGDADIPLEKNIFYLLPLLKKYPFINPYSGIYNTREDERKLLLTNQEISLNKEQILYHYTFSGGVILVNYEKFKEMNFFYEFSCYGNEDRIIDSYLDTNKIPVFNDNFIYIHLKAS